MRPAALVAGLILLGAALAAPTPSKAQFAASVQLVEVYATVTDRAGQRIAGLQAADFEVFEDGQPQKVEVFAAGDFPLALALAVDHSSSMAGRRLQTVKEATRAFLAQLRHEDRVMVVGVSSEVTTLSPLSADRAGAARAIDRLAPWGTTSLCDAVIAGIGAIQPAHGRRALVVLSDGEDRYSAAGPAAVLDRARGADVLVYPIALGGAAPPLFAEVAALTGGRSFHFRDARHLQQGLADIARELRFQYLLGYSPARPLGPTAAGSGWRSIQVKVRRPNVRVRARDGYEGS